MTTKEKYIQESAYYIWLNRGKPEGQDVEIWNEAVKIYELTHTVLAPVAKPTSKPVAKKSAPAKKPVAKKTATKKAEPTKKSVAKKTTSKPVAKKTSVKATKPVAKKMEKVEVAKIIPMVKKDVAPTKKLSNTKTKIKIVVGGKK